MATINLTFAGLPGYVTHGNSITLEAMATWKIDPTQGFIAGPIHEAEPMALDPDEVNTTNDIAKSTNTSQLPDGQYDLSAFGGDTE